MKNKHTFKNDAHSLYNIGMAHIAKGDFGKGKEFLLKAVELDKRDPELKHTLGAMLINEILKGRKDHFNLTEKDVKQLELAEKYLTQAIKLLEPTERKRQLENAYIHRSVSRAILDKRKEAILDISKAIELNPANPIAYDQRAKMLMADNRVDEAIKDCILAIRKGANKNEIAPFVVSAYLDVPQPLPDEALKFITKVYEKKELDEELTPQVMLVHCYTVKKDFDKAKELLSKLYEKLR